MVDGKSLVGLTHDEAVTVIKATQKLVQLVVATEHAEGESVTSSLQSIPEKLANRVNLVGVGAAEPLVGPEVFQSPQKNAFQLENYRAMEMKNISVEDASSGRGYVEEETKFEGSEIISRDYVRVVELVRADNQPLGFSISEGLGKGGIFIRSIDPKGQAGKDLHEGDQLLKVNGISLEKTSRQEAHNLLTVSSVIEEISLI